MSGGRRLGIGEEYERAVMKIVTGEKRTLNIGEGA